MSIVHKKKKKKQTVKKCHSLICNSFVVLVAWVADGSLFRTKKYRLCTDMATATLASLLIFASCLTAGIVSVF